MRLQLSGELDVATAGHLVDLAAALPTRGAEQVCIDLTKLEFIDVAGLRALVAINALVVARGARFTLTGLSPLAQRMLEVTGLDGLFGTADALHLPYSTVAAALARRHIDAASAGWHPVQRDIAMVLTSEIVTDAVLNGAGPVVLTVREGARRVRIEVSNGDRCGPDQVDEAAAAGESGNGQRLLDALASYWCSEVLADEAGTTTWFELEHTRGRMHLPAVRTGELTA